MKKNIMLKSAFDGIIQTFGLMFLSVFVTSELAKNVSLKQLLHISSLGAALLSNYYLLVLLREVSNKTIIWFSLGSICSLSLCIAILFAVQLTCPIDIFSMRKLNDADGIVILFTTGCFVLSSALLRLCVFIALLIKNMYQSRARK